MKKNAGLSLAVLYGDLDIAAKISQSLKITFHPIKMHTFPDDEKLIKIDWDASGQTIALLTSLHIPDSKITPLIFAAETLRTFGAKSVILIAPYLPYMRQDKQFHPGEGISSKFFASILSHHFDGLITIDPHLHRYQSLAEIYTIPTITLHADALISDWLNNNIQNAIIIGPDAESEQWVKAVAAHLQLPFTALRKTRKGDRNVEIEISDIQNFKTFTPILIDDIISSGQTILETCRALNALGFKKPVVISIHGVFAQDAYPKLLPACTSIITTNTINHISNQIDISELISKTLERYLL